MSQLYVPSRMRAATPRERALFTVFGTPSEPSGDFSKFLSDMRDFDWRNHVFSSFTNEVLMQVLTE